MKLQSLSPYLLLGGMGLGCSNWLGLDDLRFESGAGSGGNSPLGTGGESWLDVGEPTSTEEIPPPASDVLGVSDSFPSSWPAGTLFAVEQGSQDPFYFAYEPGEHRLTIMQLGLGDDLVAEVNWAVDQTWTHLVAISSSTGPILVGYDANTGIVERASTFREDGTFPVTRSAGNQHSHLLLWFTDQGRMLFGYDQETGFYRGVAATSEDDVPVLQGTTSSGWSSVVAMRYADEPALLFHSAATGEFALFRPNEGELEHIGDGQTTAGLVGFAWPGQAGLALYDASLGDVEWVTLVDQDSGAAGAGGAHSLVTEWGSPPTWYLRRNLSWIGAFEFRGAEGILSFDGDVLDLNFPWDDPDQILR